MLVAFLLAVMILRVKIMKAELPVFTVYAKKILMKIVVYSILHL